MAHRTWGMTIIAALAVIQSFAGVVRALQWIDIGSDLLGQGLLLLPAVGMIAIFRGILIGVVASLFLIFAWGLLLQRGWAKALGITVAMLNLLLVASVLVQGESTGRVFWWMVVPVVMLGYMVFPSGSRGLQNRL